MIPRRLSQNAAGHRNRRRKIMLELLLRQYEETFGKPFPLLKVKGMREIDVINIVYECLYSNTEYYDNMPIPENRFPDAPGMQKMNE
jgi:hypothetical protein